MLKILKDIDLYILNTINIKFRNKIFDKVMPIITSMGNLGVVWILLSALLITKSDYRLLGKMIIAALIITTILGEVIIKNIVKRKRPFYVNEIREKELLINQPITYSFPSGHTASSFAVVAVFIEMDNIASIAIILLAILIAFSRMYLGVHYPSDVFAGGIIGFLCGIFTVFIFLSVFY